MSSEEFDGLVSMLLALGILFGYPIHLIVRIERKRRYFASPKFLSQKEQVSDVVAEHNQISLYVAELRNSSTFSVGGSSSGSQAHLTSYDNTSRYNYRRDRNIANYSSGNVQNGSLQVVRNAHSDPIKYLIKYFVVDVNDEKLAEIEKMGESISRLENAVNNLRLREISISEKIAPPDFILKHYLAEFHAQLALSVPKITIPYPVYVFQYVSAGGNSSQETRIELKTPKIDALIESISEKIRFKKSAAGQRSLMTARLREHIKKRDNYTCKNCKVSTMDEANLLLEVDHIMPVSKGGISIDENLQTLCWKCNRSKSNKYDNS